MSTSRQLEELKKLLFDGSDEDLYLLFLRPLGDNEPPVYVGCVGSSASRRAAADAQHAHERAQTDPLYKPKRREKR